MEDFLWVEKYRPQTINDCILPEHIKNIDECPSEMKVFIKKIEDFTKNKISLISYGPDRNQTFAL